MLLFFIFSFHSFSWLGHFRFRWHFNYRTKLLYCMNNSLIPEMWYDMIGVYLIFHFFLFFFSFFELTLLFIVIREKYLILLQLLSNVLVDKTQYLYIIIVVVGFKLKKIEAFSMKPSKCVAKKVPLFSHKFQSIELWIQNYSNFSLQNLNATKKKQWRKNNSNHNISFGFVCCLLFGSSGQFEVNTSLCVHC